jgi:hypothetical protein
MRIPGISVTAVPLTMLFPRSRAVLDGVTGIEPVTSRV